jgi:hypothetical protein
MSRFLPWAALCALGAFLQFAVPACSSSDDDDGAPGTDAGTPDQGAGDDDDSDVIQVPEAEGPQFDAFVGAQCNTTGGCTTGEVCGFPADGTGGCTQVGTCVVPDPPTNDAGVVLLACSCEDQNVPYVTATLTSFTVMSPTPCVDGGAPCSTSNDCASIQVCGFPSDGAGGCMQTGNCVFPDPPTNDAGVVLTACSCEGQNVPYVTATLTSTTVISSTPCVDAGVDAGDAGDASLDGSLDAAATD